MNEKMERERENGRRIVVFIRVYEPCVCLWLLRLNERLSEMKRAKRTFAPSRQSTQSSCSFTLEKRREIDWRPFLVPSFA